MTYTYFRYTIEERLELQDVHRTVGEIGGLLVRVDRGDGRTAVTVAVPSDRRHADSSRFGAGVEVSEDEVLTVSG